MRISKSEYDKRRVAQRRTNGICRRCSKNSIPDRSICQECDDKVKTLRQSRIEQGLCDKCGKFKAEVGLKCSGCAAKNRLSCSKVRKKQQKVGLCSCGRNPLAPDRTLCLRCLDKANQATKERQRRKLEQGLCIICDKARAEGSRHCEFHTDQQARVKKNKRMEYRSNRLCERCGSAAVLLSPDRVSVVCREHFLKHLAGQNKQRWQRANLDVSECPTWQELSDLFDKQSVCPYTHVKLILGVTASLDHKMPPKYEGGMGVGNLQFVYEKGDFSVNRMKGENAHEKFHRWIVAIGGKIPVLPEDLWTEEMHEEWLDSRKLEQNPDSLSSDPLVGSVSDK